MDAEKVKLREDLDALTKRVEKLEPTKVTLWKKKEKKPVATQELESTPEPEVEPEPEPEPEPEQEAEVVEEPVEEPAAA